MTIKRAGFKRLTSLRDLFFSRVEVREGCWGSHVKGDGKGYWRIRFEGRRIRANRVSWILHNGPIPDGLQVLHRCDNPVCANPEHLFLGDHGVNAQDKSRKGRCNPAIGERGGFNKLRECEAIAILSSMETTGQLAKRYGVSPPTICDIRKRRTWKHLSDVLQRATA